MKFQGLICICAKNLMLRIGIHTGYFTLSDVVQIFVQHLIGVKSSTLYQLYQIIP